MSGTRDIISVCYVQILIYMYILYFVILYRCLCPNPNLYVYFVFCNYRHMILIRTRYQRVKFLRRKCSLAEKLRQLFNCSSLQMRSSRPHSVLSTCRASEQASNKPSCQVPCWHEDFTLPLYLIIWQPDTLYYW